MTGGVERAQRPDRRQPGPELLLHVGAYKCGSSSLQTYLSEHAEGTLAPGTPFGEAPYSYVAIRPEVTLVGSGLARVRHYSYWRYQVSVDLGRLSQLSEERFTELRGSLAALVDEGIVPIISSEGYFRHPDELGEFLSRLGLRAHVLMYVRPQVRLVNSAWWQWGLWQNKSLDDFAAALPLSLCWTERMKLLLDQDQVHSGEVRLLRPDMIQRLVQVPAGVEVARVNESLPPLLVKALLSQRGLRGVHASQFDFVLRRWLDLPGGGADPNWVLSRDQVARIIDTCAADNEALSTYLVTDDLVPMAEDLDWWSPDSYPYGQQVDPSPRPSEEDLTAIVGLLIDGLLRADRQVQDLLGAGAS